MNSIIHPDLPVSRYPDGISFPIPIFHFLPFFFFLPPPVFPPVAAPGATASPVTSFMTTSPPASAPLGPAAVSPVVSVKPDGAAVVEDAVGADRAVMERRRRRLRDSNRLRMMLDRVLNLRHYGATVWEVFSICTSVFDTASARDGSVEQGYRP